MPHLHFGSAKIEEDNALSAFAILRRRYISGGMDIFGLGNDLCQTRFGAFAQRLSDVYVKYSTNSNSPAARELNASRKWDFANYRPLPKAISRFKEVEAPIETIIPWLEVSACVFDWYVDVLGNLRVKRVYGYVSYHSFIFDINR